MQTETHSINDVLSKNATAFFIPPFQRAYAWGKTEIERYFSDIMRIINSELDETQSDKLEHFFGTLVIKEEKSGFVNRSIVVDGQQRLTTTLIFLIALRDNEEDTEKKDFITDNFLKNSASNFQDKIKLKQVTKDWDAYRALVTGKAPKPSIIKNAYDIFFQHISENKKRRPEIKIEHYITALSRINVAVIFLDERPFKGEDPQIIFETLNSLGKPLTLSDLIRNYILLNMESENQTRIYETLWYPQIELPLKENVSNFFRDFLQYKTSSSIKAISDNNTKEIYAQFKTFVDGQYANHNAFIEDIVQYVKPYSFIIQEHVNDELSTDKSKDMEIKELLRNIFHDITTESFKPLLMGLLYYHQNEKTEMRLSDEAFISMLKTIRTYLIRRRILKLTQGENKGIVILCSKVPDLVQSKITLLNLLSQLSYNLRFPNDSEVRQALLVANFYEEFKKYGKFILGKIEEYNAKVAVDFRDTKITIEHIMPQTLTDEWKAMLGNNYDEVFKKYLHNIGNLILTEFNGELGNRPFAEKKKILQTSSLRYRLEIIANEIWNEAAIQTHQATMIDLFLETFSLPEAQRSTNNWNTDEPMSERNEFSPLDDDAGDFAEGNKPLALVIGGHTFKVSTWQDVFIQFITFIKTNKNYDFQFIYDYQSELFGKADTIVYWRSLKAMLDTNSDLRNKYKSPDGLFYDKIEHLHDEEIFLHVNISSRACLTRIANVMNKLNMPNDFVTVILN